MTSDSQSESIKLTVDAEADGQRIDRYLSGLFSTFSRTVLQKAISAGGVQVNGHNVKPSHKLTTGEIVNVRLPEEPDSDVKPEAIPLDIVYEDDALVVVNKAAGMIVHPGKSHHTGTLAGALQHHFDTLSDAAGKQRPGIVHRLDRDTTGIIVIARSNLVHHHLSRQFEQRTVKKEYRALVNGEMNLDADHITTHIKVDPKKRERMVICDPEPNSNSREAATYYEVTERFRGYSHVALLPKTGRTHQLRVHMQHVGHPLIADRMYRGGGALNRQDLNHGEPNEILIRRHALHAFRLSFDHPESGERVTFEAPLAEDMQRTLTALREHRSR